MTLPRLIEPAELASAIAQNPALLLVDLRKREHYLQGHIPGAVHLDTADLVSGVAPATGALPPVEKLAGALQNIGFDSGAHVVAYDDEGGPWAGRLGWTLDMIGHDNWSCLNGGIHSWRAENRPLATAETTRQPTRIELAYRPAHRMTIDDILKRLHDKSLLIWDARSRDEYTGKKVVSQRGSHIPGAVHLEWTNLLDPVNHLRFRKNLATILAEHGITPDRDIVTHCQTHRRSGVTYLAARTLGYPSISAYDGSWAEWGNRPDTPVATSTESD